MSHHATAPEGVDPAEWAAFVDGAADFAYAKHSAWQAALDAEITARHEWGLFDTYALRVARNDFTDVYSGAVEPQPGEWLRPAYVHGIEYWRRCGTPTEGDNAFRFEPRMLDEYHARYLAMEFARDTDGEIIDPRYRSDREVAS